MRFILFFVLLTCSYISSVVGQSPVEPIFTVKGDSIVTKAKYIDSLDFSYGFDYTPSYRLLQSCNFLSADGSSSYVGKISDDDGEEGGKGKYFRNIEIESGGKKILNLKQVDAWEVLPDHVRSFATNNYFLTVPLANKVTAFICIGHSYQSEPGLLTIAILNGNYAKLVYNKQIIVRKIESSNGSFVMTLQDMPIYYNEDGTSASSAKIFKIWKEDGVFKFDGPCGTVTTED